MASAMAWVYWCCPMNTEVVSEEDERREQVRSAAAEGAFVSAAESAAIAAVGGRSAATYGEITRDGFAALAHDLRVSLCAGDVFADLGSGLGRSVFQAASDFGVRRAVGIEMAASRHALAASKLAGLRDSDVISRCLLVQGDCSDAALWSVAPGADAPLAEASVIYIASLLFSSELMTRLAQRIVEMAGNGQSSLRVVATLKRFRRGALRRARLRERLPPAFIDMSWSPSMGPGQPVYIYVRRHPAAEPR